MNLTVPGTVHFLPGVCLRTCTLVARAFLLLIELSDPSIPRFHTMFAGLSCLPQSTNGATQFQAQSGDPEAGQWAAIPSPALTS